MLFKLEVVIIVNINELNIVTYTRKPVISTYNEKILFVIVTSE